MEKQTGCPNQGKQRKYSDGDEAIYADIGCPHQARTEVPQQTPWPQGVCWVILCNRTLQHSLFSTPAVVMTSNVKAANPES
jgi:hypothetical protein